MTIRNCWYACLAIFVIGFVGCSTGGRTAVDAYPDALLSGKRVMLLLPTSDRVVLTNSDAYAASRGGAAASARQLLNDELRVQFAPAIDALLDSNVVLHYATQSIGQIIALNTESDFSGPNPISWDKMRKVGRDGNLDFLIVLTQLAIDTHPDATARGSESISGTFTLLDLQKGVVVASGEFVSDLEDITSSASSYTHAARALVRELPFHVDETTP